MSYYSLSTASSWLSGLVRKNYMFVAVLSLLCLALYANNARLLAEYYAPSAYGLERTLADTLSAQQPSNPQNAAPAVVSTCSKSTFKTPDAIDLTNRPTGLTTIVDPVHTYTIYGSTGDDLRDEIRSCAPRDNATDTYAEYTAQTGYYLSWQFEYGLVGTESQCRVLSPKVGLHVGIALPSWDTSYAKNAAFADQWEHFMSNLTAHENGHVELGKQYANRMLAQLQNFPSTNCSTLEQSVNIALRNTVNSLERANQAYDDTTQHGTTQGAVLP